MKTIVKVYREPWSATINFMFGQEREDGKLYIVKPMEMTLEPYKEGEHRDPSLRIGYDMAPQFLKALAEALAEEGVKTDNDHKIQGLLDATKYHLEDMRKLMKLK